MVRQTAAVHFSKEQTFPTLRPTLIPFQFLFLFPCILFPSFLAILDYSDSLPGLSLHLEHSLGRFKMGPDKPDFPGAGADSAVTLGN